MKSKPTYYLILFVYALLWTCQLIICHLTHSLIILTDSYINLYKILDITLGILHLLTQQEVRARKQSHDGAVKDSCHTKHHRKPVDLLAVRVFGRICTYEFKRLPLLGSFVNRLFLAALLMSAAIEGIQTCFHATHGGSEQSILLAQPITYPAILVGFALVGAIMQWCSCKAHEMCEKELESESLLNLRLMRIDQRVRNDDNNNKELHADQLEGNLRPVLKFEPYPPSPFLEKGNERRNTNRLGSRALSLCLQNSRGEQPSKKKFVLNSSSRHRSFETVPTDSYGDLRSSGQISLKSLKMGVNPETQAQRLADIQAISGSEAVPYDLEAKREAISAEKNKSKTADAVPIIGYCISHAALAACALIVYFIHDELATEIADASLAVLVVILLFTASYPPMKKAGRVLLQTAPDAIDLDQLRKSLLSVNSLIVSIKELHVWSLTSTSNRVATCQIVLDQERIISEKQLAILIQELKFKFLDNNIKCSTIQPTFHRDQLEQQESGGT